MEMMTGQNTQICCFRLELLGGRNPVLNNKLLVTKNFPLDPNY